MNVLKRDNRFLADCHVKRHLTAESVHRDTKMDTMHFEGSRVVTMIENKSLSLETKRYANKDEQFILFQALTRKKKRPQK